MARKVTSDMLSDEPIQTIREAWAAPWKAVNEIRRTMWWPWIRLYFIAHGVAWGSRWRVYGRPMIQRYRGSTIAIGDGLEMRNWRGSNPLGVIHPCILATWSAGAAIEIGHGARVTGGAICAAESIRIGNNVTIGANCTIIDTDFHPLEEGSRVSSPPHAACAPVVIEDDVFIGTQVLILKGSRVGHGAVVGAGSVVAGEIPPRAIAAGNPAHAIREL
jgi:acetyltransferase-like isoleucine patch superfamily enzyme